MDPDMCLAQLIDEIMNGDFLEARDKLESLHGWRDAGGFAPLDPRVRAQRPGPGWPRPVERIRVILFKPSGKYYTEEEWRVPANSVGPYDMERSPDFRRIDGGSVLVSSQEPWGFPHLFPSSDA